jgi:hypothetical protein
VVIAPGAERVPRLFFGSTTEQCCGGDGPGVRDSTVERPAAAADRPAARRARRRSRSTSLANGKRRDSRAAIAKQLGVPLLFAARAAAIACPDWLRPVAPVTERERSAKPRTCSNASRDTSPPGVEATCHVSRCGDPADQIAMLTRRGRHCVMSLRGTRACGDSWRDRLRRPHTFVNAVLALPRPTGSAAGCPRDEETIDETLAARDRIEIAGIDAYSRRQPASPRSGRSSRGDAEVFQALGTTVRYSPPARSGSNLIAVSAAVENARCRNGE